MTQHTLVHLYFVYIYCTNMLSTVSILRDAFIRHREFISKVSLCVLQQ